MPRLARSCLQGGLHHVLNRGNHRQTLFHGPDDFAQFIELMAEGQRRHGIDLWGYCLMSNHWHVVVEVSRVEKLSRWLHWVCNRHVRLFHRGRRDLGGGHIYQGRYKAFPIQDEGHLHQVLRYVEANPVRAGLVPRGRDWPWSSLSRQEIKRGLIALTRPRLQPWRRDESWEKAVDTPLEAEALDALRQSVLRGTPYGSADWVRHVINENGMETTQRPRGRPAKVATGP